MSERGINQIITSLLLPHKTVRDPVHGDILLNRLEVALVDNAAFQRLRHHKQLGLSYMVYPGAEHSRFQHALGTLYVASLIIDRMNSNAKRYTSPSALYIDSYGELLTRTSALLHDATNIPYGHTLEDEGLLVKPDWKDEDRVDIVFNEDNYVFRSTMRAFTDADLRHDSKLAEEHTRSFLKDVRSVLTFNEKKDEGFQFAYAADIVSNTFCADLLDYLERDAHYTGVLSKFRTDRSRAISYVFVPLTGSSKNRLVVRLWHHNRFKDDVVSELFTLLRARKDLGEAVYFHHTKVCLSAMLIAAVQRSQLLSRISKNELMGYTDDDVLRWLKSADAGPLANSLASDLEDRSLYVPVYLVTPLRIYPKSPVAWYVIHAHARCSMAR